MKIQRPQKLKVNVERTEEKMRKTKTEKNRYNEKNRKNQQVLFKLFRFNKYYLNSKKPGYDKINKTKNVVQLYKHQNTMSCSDNMETPRKLRRSIPLSFLLKQNACRINLQFANTNHQCSSRTKSSFIQKICT